MIKTLFVQIAFMLCAVNLVQAQFACGGPPSDIPPAESCPEACFYCDFSNYIGSTAGYAGDGIPPGGFCSGVQNDQWLAFVAGDTAGIITITPSNCQNGDGIQVALYGNCDEAPFVCNPGCMGCGNTPLELSFKAFVPGNTYYILIDGLSMDICDYTITVNPGSLISGKKIGPMEPIIAPSEMCARGSAQFEVPKVENAGIYEWEGPPGTLINGMKSPASVAAGTGGNKVVVTLPMDAKGQVQICVTANTACEDGPKSCVNVKAIPAPITLLPDSIRFSVIPAKDTVIIQEFPAFQGCDSFVIQKIITKLPPGTHWIRGKILWDLNKNCKADPDDLPVNKLPVRFVGPYLLTKESNNKGEFEYYFEGSKSVEIFLDKIPIKYWKECANNVQVVTPSKPGDTIDVVFLLTPIVSCPNMQVELSTVPFFRPCMKTAAALTYCNNGTSTAEKAYIELAVPKGLTVDSASIKITGKKGPDTLLFDLGNVKPFECKSFKVYLSVVCTGAIIGQTKCLAAHIYPDSLCPGWNQAFLTLSAKCLGDTMVQFKLKNVGPLPMADKMEYIIVEDVIILRKAPFQLDAGEEMLVNQKATGATLRAETKQVAGYLGMSYPSVSIEGCAGLNNPGLVNAFSQDDEEDFIDIECIEVRGSYDPNMKAAFPSGIGSEHLLEANRRLEYTIHFQNMGNDTAFYVRLEDRLPKHLNFSTFRAGASSHPCTWEIAGDTLLRVIFSPIVLPDINVNEPGSHGWFQFAIDQKANLSKGTRIENTANIYFDFNDPIKTNTVWHNVGKIALRLHEAPKGQALLWRVLGNPAREMCIFEAKRPVSGQSRFSLFDAQGKLIQSTLFTGQQFTFERASLPAGPYFFKIETEKEGVTSGTLILE